MEQTSTNKSPYSFKYIEFIKYIYIVFREKSKTISNVYLIMGRYIDWKLYNTINKNQF